MSTLVSEQKLLYHITALHNIPSIFQNGLLSRKDIEDKGSLNVTDIADSEIIVKRRELGILQYIPFHFFGRTPFKGEVFKSHADVSFCAITILREYARSNNFKICTAHPLSCNPVPKVLDYEDGIKAIDWEALDRRDYNNKYCKECCMAECLVPSPLDSKKFFSIYVTDGKMQEQTRQWATQYLESYSFHIDISPYFSQWGQNV